MEIEIRLKYDPKDGRWRTLVDDGNGAVAWEERSLPKALTQAAERLEAAGYR